MPNPVDLPDLSDGAIELLRIARENDKLRAIARNVGLLHALTLTDRLVQASRTNWRDDLNTLFRTDALPTTFVALVSLSTHHSARSRRLIFSAERKTEPARCHGFQRPRAAGTGADARRLCLAESLC